MDTFEKDQHDENDLEFSLWDHIEGNELQNSEVSWFQRTDTDRFVRLFQDALLNPNQTTKQEKFCIEKVNMDIAVVKVIINSPTVLKLVQNVRVRFVEKLANFGKLLQNYT